MRSSQRVYLKRIRRSAHLEIIVSEARSVAPSAFPPSDRAGRCGCYRPSVALSVAQDVAPKLRKQKAHGFEPGAVFDGNPIGQVGATCEIHLCPTDFKSNTGMGVDERRPSNFQSFRSASSAVDFPRQPNAYTDGSRVIQLVLLDGRDDVLTPAVSRSCTVPYPPCLSRTACGTVDPLRLDERLSAAAHTPVAAKLRASLALPRPWPAPPGVVDFSSTRADGHAFDAPLHPVFDLAAALASRFHWHGHVAPVMPARQHRPFARTTPQFGQFQPCRFLMVFSMIPPRDDANKGRRMSLRFLVTDSEPHPPKEPRSLHENPHRRDAGDSRHDGRLRGRPNTQGDTAAGVVGQVAHRSVRASAASSRVARI